MVMVNRTKVLCQHKQPKWVIYWFLETIFVIQGLLSVVYVVAMIILILSVIGEPISGADCTMVRTQGNGMVLRMPGMQGAECWVEESDGGENKLWGMRGSFFSQRIEQAPPSLTSVEFSLAKMTVPWQRLCLELESLRYG